MIPVLLGLPMTVLLEMIGVSEKDLMYMFGVPMRNVAKSLHWRVQEQVRADNPPPSIFQPGKHYDDAEDELSLGDKLLKYGSGMFFSSSAFVEQVLVVITGSGLFSSTRMSPAEQLTVSVAMLASFVWAGGLNASIGATASFYVFQWSYALGSVAVGASGIIIRS